jgi:Fe2+ transport system protein FeoA
MTTSETPANANFTSNLPAQSVDALPLGSRCRIVAVDETSENLLRLMEMGLVPGAHIVIERAAPLGGPYCLRLPGNVLAVRAEDARLIKVVLLPESDNPASALP